MKDKRKVFERLYFAKHKSLVIGQSEKQKSQRWLLFIHLFIYLVTSKGCSILNKTM